MTEIKLGLSTLRPWRESDVRSLARHANNIRIWRNLHDMFPHPYTEQDAETWIRQAATEPPGTVFAIEVAGEAAGGLGLHLQKDVHRRTGVIGYWLAECHWGRGIATEAVRALTRHAFATFDLVRLQANVFEWNPASARVLEKAGYTLEARLRKHATKEGRTADVFLYALVRE